MILYEEYCRRRNLRCPIIRRPENKLHVIYRAQPERWKVNWTLLQISLRHENFHPSYYSFGWYLPQHNGSFQGSTLQPVGEPERVEWDNYDVEVIKAAQRTDGLEPVSDLQEAKIAAWEIFLYCTDERVPNLPINVRSLICKSLDPSLTLDERLQAQDSAARFLLETGSNFATRWEQLRSYYEPATYATWFADIVKQMRDEHYRQDFSDLQSVA